MIAAASRGLMRLAVRCLGDRRHDWALAMQSEFETAQEDGKPLTFAIGCLVGALREMPAHEEGRFVIANHILAIGLILPVSVMMLSSTISDFGYPGSDVLPVNGGNGPLLTDGTRAAVPSLLAILFLLGAAHLRIAWALLECNWSCVEATGRMIAAMTVTLAMLSGLVFISIDGLFHAAVAAMELSAILVVARWHSQLPVRNS